MTTEKTSVLSVRINENLKKKIELMAQKNNQSTTDYVKDLLLKGHLGSVINNADQKIEHVERRTKELERKTTEALVPLLKNLGVAKEVVDKLSQKAEKTAESLAFSRWELISLAVGSGVSMGLILVIAMWFKF